MKDILYRSPLHRTLRLQPACLARACSMWSRKPMPVSMSTCWEAEDCEAWVLWTGFEPHWEESGKCGEEGRGSRAPPSRESETWIFVSFVSRFMSAVRAGLWCSEPMVGDCMGDTLLVEGCSVAVEGVDLEVFGGIVPWSWRIAADFLAIFHFSI